MKLMTTNLKIVSVVISDMPKTFLSTVPTVTATFEDGSTKVRYYFLITLMRSVLLPKSL
jgi:hypothetical protein